jgi:hypothetical protein
MPPKEEMGREVEARMVRQAVRDAVRTGRRDGTPIEEVVPDWAERVAAARRRADG